ncbi:MAG TPA: GAF domain-containing protein [Polyangiaceae bacterium]|nr:GAF domain-containing protein [Polyangiaceae bacterium]
MKEVVGRHNERLEATLEFAAFASRPMPLVSLLDEAPRRIAQILRAEVCSVYLLEGEGSGELVMRGNVGFSRHAIGQIRLAIGEGMVGETVEYMRPIVAALAGAHAKYKHFDELDEDKFPVFLAVPLRGKSGPVGALVVQRKEASYEVSDVEILVLLGALIAAVIRTAEVIDAQREKSHGPTSARRAGGGTRKVTLTGRVVVPGLTLGAVAALRRPASRPEVRTTGNGDQDVRMLRAAFDVAEKATRALIAAAKRLELGSQAAFLGTYVEILGDARFKERALELAAEGAGIGAALGRVAREVTRAAHQVTRDPFMEERARDIEDLCDALTMLAASDKRAELPQKAVLIGDALSVFDVLVSSRAHPVAVVLTERSGGPRTRALLELMSIPSVVDVQGLFRWASDGDVALVDADHGIFVINPSKNEIAAVRERSKQTT